MPKNIEKILNKISDHILRIDTTITETREDQMTLNDLISRKESIELAINRTQTQANEAISKLTAQLEEINAHIDEAKAMGIVEESEEDKKVKPDNGPGN